MFYVNGEVMFNCKFIKDVEMIHNVFRRINPNANTESIIAEIKNECKKEHCACDIETPARTPEITESIISIGIDLIKSGELAEAVRYSKGQIEVNQESGKVFIYSGEHRHLCSLDKLDRIRYISYSPILEIIDRKEIKNIIYNEPYIYVYDYKGFKTTFKYYPAEKKIRLSKHR